MTCKITQYTPESEDYERVGTKLTEFTLKKGGPDYQPLHVAFKASAGHIPAGELIAEITWGCMTIKLLEVRQEARRLGVGSDLLRAAEDFARTKGVRSIDLWTPTWQGVGFYERNGYRELARLPLNTNGHFDNTPQFKVMYGKTLEY